MTLATSAADAAFTDNGKREKSTSKRSKKGVDIWTHDGVSILNPHQPVAALVDAISNPRLWIQASVIKYMADRNRYQVVDEDPGDESNPNPVRKKYVLDAKKLIPLYSLDEFPCSTRREFPKGERVLAIFPNTTVFYPAYVVAGPKKRKDPSYALAFDDDDDRHTIVSAQYVIPLMELGEEA